MSYNHKKIDPKWQQAWSQNEIFKAQNPPTVAADSSNASLRDRTDRVPPGSAVPTVPSSKPKYYVLDMFPYPSGSGLHVGHLASYMPSEVIARYKLAKGFNVLHPMGYDAFGLPAEQYAIQTGVHPAVTTQKAIENYERQLKVLGFSFDWSRKISTCDSSYYKWTQWIFQQLYRAGLVYRKEAPVNWCPALKTVLANDEIVDGKSERGGHPVVRMPMRQWMIEITKYAEELVSGLDQIEWPERTKEGQRNWIGKSEGAEVQFQIHDHPGSMLTVFTTRPDTLFGVTFMVLAPEHALVAKISTAENQARVKTYQEQTSNMSDIERKAKLEKSGVDTGARALHPISGKQIPIWISDYVLMDYGTGAIMAVPGHDSRDFEFAKKMDLPILRVLTAKDSAGEELPLPFEGEGTMVNSQFLDGLSKGPAIQKMLGELKKSGVGKSLVQYKLRDWLFSRQRYWGEPFPVAHFADETEPYLVPELPVELPTVANYEPSETGESPLARATEWLPYKRASDGKVGTKNTDTMPGSAGSSWYFLRYTDPHNESAFASPEALKYWMPVDLYCGGAEHTVGHLLYSRFWNRFLYDQKLVPSAEPFRKLFHQGMMLGPDGEKMSKSRGNVINPDDVTEEYGADAVRTYICFMGPLDKDKAWATSGLEGVRRWLDRVWRLVETNPESGQGSTTANPTGEVPVEVTKLLHKTIKKVSEDIESMSYNTAISTMMIFVNELYRHSVHDKEVLKKLAQLMSPFAPHLAEEIWFRLGGQGLISLAPWPDYDKSLVVDDIVTMGVQVNGKMRGTIEISPNAQEADAVRLAKALNSVTMALHGKEVSKVIYKAGKILNLIVK